MHARRGILHCRHHPLPGFVEEGLTRNMPPVSPVGVKRHLLHATNIHNNSSRSGTHDLEGSTNYLGDRMIASRSERHGWSLRKGKWTLLHIYVATPAMLRPAKEHPILRYQLRGYSLYRENPAAFRARFIDSFLAGAAIVQSSSRVLCRVPTVRNDGLPRESAGCACWTRIRVGGFVDAREKAIVVRPCVPRCVSDSGFSKNVFFPTTCSLVQDVGAIPELRWPAGGCPSRITNPKTVLEVQVPLEEHRESGAKTCEQRFGLPAGTAHANKSASQSATVPGLACDLTAFPRSHVLFNLATLISSRSTQRASSTKSIRPCPITSAAASLWSAIFGVGGAQSITSSNPSA
jgi:hypothetical protein